MSAPNDVRHKTCPYCGSFPCECAMRTAGIKSDGDAATPPGYCPKCGRTTEPGCWPRCQCDKTLPPGFLLSDFTAHVEELRLAMRNLTAVLDKLKEPEKEDDRVWQRCEYKAAEEWRYRKFTGSIGLPASWSKWFAFKPKQTFMQHEYEYRKRRGGEKTEEPEKEETHNG